MKLQKAVPVETEGAYLNRLGKKLLLFFPAGQVLEILEGISSTTFTAAII